MALTTRGLPFLLVLACQTGGTPRRLQDIEVPDASGDSSADSDDTSAETDTKDTGAADTQDSADTGGDTDLHCDDTDVEPTWFYVDADGDGFGVPEGAVLACEAPDAKGWADNPDDCDEGNTDLPTYWYEDRDGDGWGDGYRKSMPVCEKPTAGTWVPDRSSGGSFGFDCDDSNGNVNPDQVEGNQPTDGACNDLRDNDCDGKVDLADLGCTP